MTAGAILGGLVAFFKAIPTLDGWLQQFLVAYLTSQTQATKSKIADAAALDARAATDADRYAAGAAWQAALQREREIS